MSSQARKPGWVRALSRLAWVAVLAVALASGTVLGFTDQSPVMRAMIEQTVKRQSAKDVFQTDYLNVLILGCDEDRYYAGRGHKNPGAVLRHASRSDMMLVARLDFVNKRISGISIPRDLRWSIPGYREQKINAFHAIGYNEGGADKAKELAKAAAEGVVGLPIDRVVVLNFEAFKEMIDLIGGVEVFVPKNMDYDDNAGDLHIHLKKGRQHLNGYDAMCYVRFRHNDSDFKRQERQKDLMMAVKDRALQQWQHSADLADKTIELLGRAFSAQEVAALAKFGRSVGGDNIKMDMVPVLESNGSTYLDLDVVKLQDKLKELRLTTALYSAPSGQ